MKNQDKTIALDKMLNGTLEDYILYIKGLTKLK